MDRQRFGAGLCDRTRQCQCVFRRHRRAGDVVLRQDRHVFREGVAEDQNVRFPAARAFQTADRQRFSLRGQREKPASGFPQHVGHNIHAVSIRVRLDHADHLRHLANGMLPHIAADPAVVVANGIRGDHGSIFR